MGGKRAGDDGTRSGRDDATALTEDSLKVASERSADSLSASQGGKRGPDGEPQLRMGVAVSWQLASTGSSTRNVKYNKLSQRGGRVSENYLSFSCVPRSVKMGQGLTFISLA